MEFHCKLTLKLPEEAISLFGINEDTVFETYFEDGNLVIRPISEDDLSVEVKKVKSSCDGDCETCIFEECCPYEDEEDDDDDCFPGSEECEYCEYYCRHCKKCTLDEQED